MRTKDIVNRDLANLTNCEQEPIHIPGSIQPHGFLLSLKETGLTIDFCSENCFDYIGLRHEQLLGRSFETIVGEKQSLAFREHVAAGNDLFVAPLEIQFGEEWFVCIVQKTGDTYLLEFEPLREKKVAMQDIYYQTKLFTSYTQKAMSLRQLCESIAEETRKITGYDRVMIYKFDEWYNGEVFAESLNPGIEPFFGLHYPHTDIPPQARQLYVTNLLRVIVDVQYEAVPIYTVDDSSANKNLDLSLSTLRSVSPIHIQYLKNMGVGATLTISLMHEDRLWGLIACHHYAPKYLPVSVRVSAQLQGHFLTSQIKIRELAEEYEITKNVSRSLDELLLFLSDNYQLDLTHLVQQPALATVTNAAAVIVVIDDVIYTSRPSIPDLEIRKLVSWLHSYNADLGMSTFNLSTIYPDAKKWADLVSGIIFHSLGPKPGNCIIWCRPEILQELNWAGDPSKSVIKDEKGLSPRASFGLWKEIKKNESLLWKKPELFAAANFAHAFLKHINTMFLIKEELKQRRLGEKLQEANAELENLNWIASHDLKEPLRKIQVLASRILDKEYEGIPETIKNSVEKMNDSAKRMQLLITDVLSYSKLNHIEERFELVDLNETMQGIIVELGFEIAEKNAKVKYDQLPGLKGIPFLLQQLLVNLIRNSLKFSRPAVDPLITVQYKGRYTFEDIAEMGAFHEITIRDNGIGFDNKFKDAIFKVFTRLNTNADYPGSGVGLALCKKIMQTHRGYITASAEPLAGAVFSLYFPIPPGNLDEAL